MRSPKILLPLSLIVGCQDTQAPTKLTEFLETEITIEAPFKGVYIDVESDVVAVFNYGVITDTVRIFTPSGIITKPFTHDDQRLEVTMASSSLVNGVPLNFLIVGDELLCTTCGMYNLEMRWNKISYAALPKHYDVLEEDDLHGSEAKR